MSIEEKAKAYDEALKWMRDLYPELHGATKENAEHYFPELRESEDEKNANALIRLLNSEKVSSLITFEARQQWLGWLERKKIPSVSFNPALGFDPGSAVVYHNDDSEDERIRKWIIEELEITRDAMSGKNPYSDDPDIVARLKRLDEAIDYLEKQKDFAANEYWRGFGAGRDEVIANPDAFNLQKEQKPIGIYWHKIKEGEKLPCRAYVWNIDYEKHYDCFEGRLIANLENISVGRDTWYLPADDVRNLPREGVDELPREQKPDIELIQRSWYMEGYHDRKFGMEPRWIIKTGEGGPKHELNPRYGQPLAEQQYYSKLNDLERAIHRGFLSAGVENVPVTIIKETAKDCLAHMPAEWSEEDKTRLTNILIMLQEYVIHHYSKDDVNKSVDWLKALPERFNLQPKPEWSDEDERMVRFYADDYDNNLGNMPMREVIENRIKFKDWLINKLKSLRPQPKQEWSEEDEKMLNEVLDRVTYAFYDQGNEGEIEDDPAFLWLHRLRPSWKPSEEQMEHLKRCFSHGKPHLPMPNQHVLESLYDNLKKLM